MTTTFLRRAVWRSQAPALLPGSASAPSLTFTGDPNTGFWSPAADTVAVSTGGSERLRVDSAGNLGLGVTPSGVYTLQTQLNYTSGFKGFSLGGLAGGSSQSSYPVVGYNVRLTNTADSYQYNAPDWANIIAFKSGQFQFFTAPSGTAGTAITFTQAMTLDASGRLGIGITSPAWRIHAAGGGAVATIASGSNTAGESGRFVLYGTSTKTNWMLGAQQNVDGGFEITPSTAAGGTTWTTPALVVAASANVGINENAPDYRLDVNGTFGFTPGASVTPVDNGDVVFELTNNTTLTIKAKGSDGTVRSGTVTLA